MKGASHLSVTYEAFVRYSQVLCGTDKPCSLCVRKFQQVKWGCEACVNPLSTSFSSVSTVLLAPAEDGRLRHAPQHYALPGVIIGLIHDVVVTEDYYIIVVGPIDFSMAKFVTQYMTSRCSIAECMQYKPQEKPTTVHLVPRPGGKAGRCAELDPL